MPYRVYFWKSKEDIDVWLPAGNPRGEQIVEELQSGAWSDLLYEIEAQSILKDLACTFDGSSYEEDGRIYWSDEICQQSFVARAGPQFVEVVCFELSDENLELIFEIADRFSCEHYDWGN